MFAIACQYARLGGRLQACPVAAGPRYPAVTEPVIAALASCARIAGRDVIGVRATHADSALVAASRPQASSNFVRRTAGAETT
jgi:hypothetical protein